MSINIFQDKNVISVTAESYKLELDALTGIGILKNAGGEILFEMPLGVRIEAEGQYLYLSPPLNIRVVKKSVIINAKQPCSLFSRQEIIFDFQPNAFTFHCRVTVADKSKLTPESVEYFRDPELGMRLNTLLEGFCVPKAPLSDEDYHNLFPTVSTDGMATPPILNIGLKFYHGFVGIGLLDYSNVTTFGISNPFMSLMVDALGGNLTFHSAEVYQGPKVIFTFPENGWNGIEVFRDKLKDAKQIFPSPKKAEWWKRPIYCTYGDQIMAHQPVLFSDIYWDSPLYTQEYVRKAVLNAEDQLSYKNFTVIIDAFWQKRWDTDPSGDSVRFPEMRSLINWLHNRGHKVLLWYSPHLVDSISECGKIAHKYGVIGQYKFQNELLHPSELSVIDYSSENAPAYLQAISQRLFGSGKDDLDADGVKMDFLFAIPSTETSAKYSEPQNGMGVKMIERYMKLFSTAAKAVKIDVLLNYSSSDPRISHLFGMNRLHDTKLSPLERERRARVSALACPDLLIDSDGAVMMSDWVVQTYIAASIYSTPSLYYAKYFNDGQKCQKDMMHTLGKLFNMCEERCWGRPEFINYGHWRLWNQDNRVIGESYDGKICWLENGAGKINVICFDDQNTQINLHGKTPNTINPMPHQLQISGDTITANWRGGIVYEIA